MSGVLTKVMLGEADAGLVYVTDVLAAEGVEGVDLADDEQVAGHVPCVGAHRGAEPRGRRGLRRSSSPAPRRRTSWRATASASRDAPARARPPGRARPVVGVVALGAADPGAPCRARRPGAVGLGGRPPRHRGGPGGARAVAHRVAVGAPARGASSASRSPGCSPGRRSPGDRLLRALVLLPMVVPPVIGGVALLVAFGRRGVVGQYLDDWFDIQLAYTRTAAVLAATFVSLPFFVITVEAALRGVDRRFEDAARSLGASPGFVLRHVTLPSIRGRARRRRRARLGAGARRVRRHHHLRRQLRRARPRRCRWRSTTSSTPTCTPPSS